VHTVKSNASKAFLVIVEFQLIPNQQRKNLYSVAIRIH